MKNIAKHIQALVPNKYSQFGKLTLSGGKPYCFDSWTKDNTGTLCLYYWFWDRNNISKNKKRAPLSEIESAARECVKQGIFDRNVFKTYCPTAASDGPCGFAVIGRCLEYLGIAKYKGRGKGFHKK